MATEDTNNYSTTETAVPAKTTSDVISADEFNQMVDVLDSLLEHKHTFTDNYTTNCECECGGGGTI